MSFTLRPGEVVDRYTVEQLLGEGGMAAVYGVRHKTLGSTHALKVLKVSDPRIRERLVAEGQAQAALRHPNIVMVTDVLDVRGQPGLLMERVDGPSLEQWLDDNRPSLEDALKLFRGILAGVTRAHRAGFVHRDLKPGNVLLDTADDLVFPKVADFGLAKVLDDPLSHSQTRSGFAMGTPQFMAPEQIRSAKDVDRRADIFALGCILYRLVCGRVPFEAPDLLDLYNLIATGVYPVPESLVPDLPARVGETLRACLKVDRDARPADCDEVRRMLYGDDASIAGGVRVGGTFRAPVREGGAAGPPLPDASTQADWFPGSMAPAASSTGVGSAAAPPASVTMAAPKRRVRWIMLAAALVLASAGGALYAGRVEAPEPRAAPPRAARQPVEAPAVEAPAVEPAPPVAAPTLTPAAPRPEAPSPPTRPVEAPIAPIAVTPGAPPVSETGMVIVNSRPYSDVSIDGAPRGPTSFRGELPVGDHTVVLTRPTGETHALTVTAVSSQETSYCWDFAQGAACRR